MTIRYICAFYSFGIQNHQINRFSFTAIGSHSLLFSIDAADLPDKDPAGDERIAGKKNGWLR